MLLVPAGPWHPLLCPSYPLVGQRSDRVAVGRAHASLAEGVGHCSLGQLREVNLKPFGFWTPSTLSPAGRAGGRLVTVPSPRCHWGEEGRERVFGQETEPGRKRGCWQRPKPQWSAEAPREVPCRARTAHRGGSFALGPPAGGPNPAPPRSGSSRGPDIAFVGCSVWDDQESPLQRCLWGSAWPSHCGCRWRGRVGREKCPAMDGSSAVIGRSGTRQETSWGVERLLEGPVWCGGVGGLKMKQKR